jgi:hypothetical protein
MCAFKTELAIALPAAQNKTAEVENIKLAHQ